MNNHNQSKIEQTPQSLQAAKYLESSENSLQKTATSARVDEASFTSASDNPDPGNESSSDQSFKNEKRAGRRRRPRNRKAKEIINKKIVMVKY